MSEDMTNSSSLYLYREIKKKKTLLLNVRYTCTLYMLEDVKYREILVNLYDDKLSSHKLSIELDRRSRIDRYKRKCSNCNLRDSKVKYPFVLICPDPSDLRKSHCPLYYFNVENDITCTLINAKKSYAVVLCSTKIYNRPINFELLAIVVIARLFYCFFFSFSFFFRIIRTHSSMFLSQVMSSVMSSISVLIFYWKRQPLRCDY